MNMGWLEMRDVITRQHIYLRLKGRRNLDDDVTLSEMFKGMWHLFFSLLSHKTYHNLSDGIRSCTVNFKEDDF